MSDKGFDRIAFIYDWLAKLVFGNGILHAATLGMTEVKEGDRVLILGGGSGKVLAAFRQENFPKEIVYVEPSAEMVAKAKEVWASMHIPASTSIQWILATDRFVQGQDIYDVLITPFVLDLFPEKQLTEVFSRLHRTLKVGGIWLYADFFIKEDSFRLLRHMLVKLMYAFFSLICGVKNHQLAKTSPLFEQHGYQLLSRKEFSSAMIEGIIYRKA